MSVGESILSAHTLFPKIFSQPIYTTETRRPRDCTRGKKTPTYVTVATVQLLESPYALSWSTLEEIGHSLLELPKSPFAALVLMSLMEPPPPLQLRVQNLAEALQRDNVGKERSTRTPAVLAVVDDPNRGKLVQLSGAGNSFSLLILRVMVTISSMINQLDQSFDGAIDLFWHLPGVTIAPNQVVYKPDHPIQRILELNPWIILDGKQNFFGERYDEQKIIGAVIKLAMERYGDPKQPLDRSHLRELSHGLPLEQIGLIPDAARSALLVWSQQILSNLAAQQTHSPENISAQRQLMRDTFSLSFREDKKSRKPKNDRDPVWAMVEQLDSEIIKFVIYYNQAQSNTEKNKVIIEASRNLSKQQLRLFRAITQLLQT